MSHIESEFQIPLPDSSISTLVLDPTLDTSLDTEPAKVEEEAKECCNCGGKSGNCKKTKPDLDW
ncbi:hypothetical protein NADFUDRAFT_82804 [Nadsonia fulvescens var. elongata DSM 6958]|uniref:Uncharacterized protein n=1 Tax=Nadsonia fulvescens var. elongata DSM 6958 TaxID=857566 RepID=A0A1E3PM00_9ASCO|nr:hypothetical protein NADFUDRAFT_82804 [Nadsonia fulvescens var. elongata DSM 6958]